MVIFRFVFLFFFVIFVYFLIFVIAFSFILIFVFVFLLFFMFHCFCFLLFFQFLFLNFTMSRLGHHKSSSLCIFLLVLKIINRASKLWKVAASYRNNDCFCTNRPEKYLQSVSKQSVKSKCNKLYFTKYFAKYSQPQTFTFMDNISPTN